MPPRPANLAIPGHKMLSPLACLPLAFRFYHMRKTIDAGNVKANGKIPPFQTKFDQAVEMPPEISAVFPDTPLFVVTDNRFGNDGLFKPMRKAIGQHMHILSRLRVCLATIKDRVTANA
jgi:hypothetical protein